MARYAFTVFSNPVAGQEQEYNRWYDEQHLGDVLKVPGFVAAQRFKLAQPDPDVPAQYLAIYQFDCDDLQNTMTALQERAGTQDMPLSPALEVRGVKAFIYEAITDLRRR